MVKHHTLLGWLLLASLTPSANASNFTVDALDGNHYVNWITKSVCVNGNGALLAVDPYGGCPANSFLRKMQIGDPLPYANFDQTQAQRSDSIPLYDSAMKPIYMNTFDFPPFGKFNLYDGSDGYNVVFVKNGMVSWSNTKDGGGFGQTFFGADCTVGDGWRLFPTTGLLNEQETSTESLINGIYWEMTGQSFPGTCITPTYKVTTSYKLSRSFTFGGPNGAYKTMDTLISTHGKSPENIERSFFTREYGLTRWEAWSTRQTNYVNQCSTVTPPFPGYYLNDCRDWSLVGTTSVSPILQWPVVNANLLQHAHFDLAGFDDTTQTKGLWHRFPAQNNSPVINWSALVSTSNLDRGYYLDNTVARYLGTGTRYLAMNCGATTCPASGTQAIYQDVPLSAFCSGCTYMYGVDARTASGSGVLLMALAIVDPSQTPNTVVTLDVTNQNLTSDNGNSAWNESSSVVRSSAFVSKTVTMPSLSNFSPSAYVRMEILPGSPHTFSIIDAFLNPIPTVTTTVVQP